MRNKYKVGLLAESKQKIHNSGIEWLIRETFMQKLTL